MNLSVRLDKLELKNPIIIAAGPWARDAHTIQLGIDSGAGAVTTETITLEANPNLSPRMYVQGEQTLNIKMFSDLHLEQWENELNQLHKRDCRLICSIWGNSPSEISNLAAKLARRGADAIEVSLSPPIRNRAFSTEPSRVSGLLRAAVEAAKGVPVIAKLSYEACHSLAYTRGVQEAGVHIVSAIDGLKGLIGVDIERRVSIMPTYGGYNGSGIRPLALAATAILRQNTPFFICSGGGTLHFAHAIESIMLGASCVELASLIQIYGYGAVTALLDELTVWMESHDCQDLNELRGAALPSLHLFDDLKPYPLHSSLVHPCSAPACRICIDGCLYGAIRRDGDTGITVDSVACSGCGHCVARCPEKALVLRW